MKVQENIGKITWSFGDKVLFILYGFVSLFQMRALQPSDFGLFFLLINLQNWLFILSDSFALQSMIQFGMNKNNQAKVNTIGLLAFVAITMTASGAIFLFRYEFAGIFHEPNLVHVGKILPVLIVFTIPKLYCQKFIYRELDYKNLFMMDTAFFGVMALVSIYLLLTRPVFTFMDMVYIYAIGAGLSSIAALFLTRKHLRFGFKGEITIKQLLRFSVPYAMYSALHNLPRQLDVYVIKLFYSTDVVGVYSAAKTLYRVFDEGTIAAYGLVYPSALRQIENKNYKGLMDLMTKSISFLTLSFAVAILLLEVGIGKFFIESFLPMTYKMAVPQFSLLILIALALPFTLLASIITANGKPQIVLIYTFCAVAVSFAVMFFVGKSGNSNLVPLGYMSYIFVLGSLSYFHIFRHYDFPPQKIFRAVGDSKNFIINYFDKQKKTKL